MKVPFVDLKAQYNSLKDEIDNAIFSVINDTAFIGGKYKDKFEEEFAALIGAEYCISCGNGTDALQISLMAYNIGRGDEVIVPANTFIATSEAVTASGASVVFCEVDEQTNNLDINKLQENISSKTKAIIPVHLYGMPSDMVNIVELAKLNNLKVIEDAAQAHLAKFNGKNIGTFGDAACFSFYPGKNLGAYGDAGAIITSDEEFAKKVRMIANHGRTLKYEHEFEGRNSRMDGLQAAILSAKLPYLKTWTDKRREAASLYNKLLKGVGDIILPYEAPEYFAVYHLYVIKTAKRDALQSFLKEKGIATGIHYPIGLPFQPAYKYLNHSINDFPVTAKNQELLLSLPIYPEISGEQINYVCNSIKDFYSKR